ncbi:hypothetical protein GCM10018790_64180 [Kitasatospora xanthocidica]|uniref:hypothetical protein n=1 Tax=Kitasatospora xanthocidica TaxID=83382 RepID=UPI0016781A1F|nr:hypothetical protein [Kitasatospora xanthocidica]GHF77237.1 hypothetical protein GCM10018790_64180 [Kitasatospora xanthocidica]
MIRHPRAWWDHVSTWWLLNGQFSRPVRAVSPSRQAAHRDALAWYAEPGFAEDQRVLLMRQTWRKRAGVDDPLLDVTEAELFRRILGCEKPTRDRT